KWHRVKSYSHQLEELDALRQQRVDTSVAILDTLHRRATALRELFAPVQQLIDEEPHIREALGVQFSVQFSFEGFVTRIFDFIKQSAGSFVGLEESKALAIRLVSQNDLMLPEGLRKFLDEVEDTLHFDIRGGAKRAVS